MPTVQLALLEELDQPQPHWFCEGLASLGVEEIGGWPDNFGDALSEWFDKEHSRKINVLSLFSGGGGLDIGFHDAGFNVVECNEIENRFAETLRHNAQPGGRLQGTSVICEDIKDYTPSLEDIDFIIGGPPCQTFSAAGARAAGVNGIDDDRGNLFQEYARILDKLKPKGFLFENVYRIVGAQGGKPWNLILSAFRELGYELHWRILDAADYGVPQFRERLIIVGLKTGSYCFPVPTHGPDSLDGHAYYTAGLAVSGLPPGESYPKPPAGRHGHLLPQIPAGLNYSYFTERMGHPTPIFAWRSKFSDYLYKADPGRPIRTLKAQGGQYTGPFSWENRPFTIGELKRLQTFPDSYSVLGGRQVVVHQLGNSVPPQLARILALSIREQVFKAAVPFSIPQLEAHHELGFRARKSNLSSHYLQIAQESISREKLVSTSQDPYPFRSAASFCLMEDLSLRLAEGETDAARVITNLTESLWRIELRPSSIGKSKKMFQITVTPSVLLRPKEIFKRIELLSYSSEPRALTMVWKVLERSLNHLKLKDDLVQLFGYYQYARRYSIKFELFDASIKNKSLWSALEAVSEGCGVGAILNYQDLAATLGLKPCDVYAHLIELKKLGFEIRSHRTNKQIHADCFLIPYSFPTLNERSLQRLTEL